MIGGIPITKKQRYLAGRTDLVALLRSRGETLKKLGSEWEWKFLDEADAPQRPDMGERVGGAGDPTKIGNYGHICLLRDIAQAVRDGRSPAIPPQEAALAVRVICSIYESTRTGRPIVF